MGILTGGQPCAGKSSIVIMSRIEFEKSEMLQQLQVLDNIINDAIKNYESLDR